MLTWIGFAGPMSAVAAGTSYPQGADGPSHPLVVTSSDGGFTWRTAVPVLPSGRAAAWPALRFEFVSATLGFATVDPNQSRSAAVRGGAGIRRTSEWLAQPRSAAPRRLAARSA